MTLISIIIPCRNESKFIGKCLDSVLSFKLPDHIDTEIFVIDGKSVDDTIVQVQKKINENPQKKIKIVENSKMFAAYAINIGIQHSSGDYILRLDAHSVYPENYLSLCYETSIATSADNVGGIVITLPGSNKYAAKLVQALTTHKFGVGDSGFRVGMAEKQADTVPYGFFRRTIFDKIGFFDERLIRAQDYEFNRRIGYIGGKVWLNPQIQIQYFNQPSLYAFYKKQFYKEAPYNAYMWSLAPYAFTLRHAVTGIFTLSILMGIIISSLFPFLWYLFFSVLSLYFLLAFLSAIQQVRKFKEPFFCILLPFCFFLFHFIHGLGLLTGIVKLLFKKSPVQNTNQKPWLGAYSNNLVECVQHLNKDIR